MLRVGSLRGCGVKRASRKLASLKHPADLIRLSPPLLGATPKGAEYRQARWRSLNVTAFVVGLAKRKPTRTQPKCQF
tara:strand:- start:205 stop:435 length:231 start_codon:yes stop_codon:yes gene_type:complete